MTSNHYFFKYMKEDLRHKTWMIALSVLGNALALPIAFMVMLSNIADYRNAVPTYAQNAVMTYARNLMHFFSEYSLITAGLIAIGGAIIVGLTSFRYLQNKSMSDTYQSLPLTKNQLFFAGYLNGFLIWFVPMLVCMLLTLIYSIGSFMDAASFFEQVKETDAVFPSFGAFLGGALATVGTLILIYLLVLNLILLAFVLTGNALNTLAVAAIIGGGVGAIFLCIALLESTFIDTLLVTVLDQYGDWAIYLSPIALAFVLLMRTWGFFRLGYIVAGAVMAILLGVATYFCFVKRPVELAEQGTKNKIVTTLCTLAASFVSGVIGWFIFSFILNGIGSEDGSAAWGIFGCILTSVFITGVINVIFHMEFAAFLKRKVVMLVGTLLPLLTCLIYLFDVFGVDTYLPKKDAIASAGIIETSYVDWTTFAGAEFTDKAHALNQMQITDADAIYTILENAVTHVNEGPEMIATYEMPAVIEGEDVFYPDYAEISGKRDTIYVRVTLKSGRTYYRKYIVDSRDDNTALYNVMISKEYVDALYPVDEALVPFITSAYLNGTESYELINERSGDTKRRREVLRQLVVAYNQDIAQNPSILYGNSEKALCTLELYCNIDENLRIDRSVCISEGAPHMLQVLKDNHLLEEVTVGEIDIKKITIHYDGMKFEDQTAFDKVLYAQYGLDPAEVDKPFDLEAVKAQMKESLNPNAKLKDKYQRLTLEIVNTEDIAALMDDICPEVGGRYWGIFNKQEQEVIVTDAEGEEHYYCILQKRLPLKYVQFFRAANAMDGQWE